MIRKGGGVGSTYKKKYSLLRGALYLHKEYPDLCNWHICIKKKLAYQHKGTTILDMGNGKYSGMSASEKRAFLDVKKFWPVYQLPYLYKFRSLWHF